MTFYSWVNPLFRLGHGFNSYVTNYQRVHWCTLYIYWSV
jgi:hypothetical protein